MITRITQRDFITGNQRGTTFAVRVYGTLGASWSHCTEFTRCHRPSLVLSFFLVEYQTRFVGVRSLI